jgi:hypothetical protein
MKKTLRCALCCIISSTPLHYTTLHHTTPHHTTLHYTPLHSTPQLHSTTLHYTPLHYITPHNAALLSTPLHPYLNKKNYEHHDVYKEGRAHSQATDVIIKRKVIVKDKVAVLTKGKKRV